MTRTDPVPHWTRRIALLQKQAAKTVRSAPCGELTDTALETCEALLRDLAGAHLECDRRDAEARAANDAWDHLFEVMPAACVLTNTIGQILGANRAAGVALNVNADRLKDRELIVFCEHRLAFDGVLERLRLYDGGEIRAALTFRPRERRPAPLNLAVTPLNGNRSGLWLWVLTPAANAVQRLPAESA